MFTIDERTRKLAEEYNLIFATWALWSISWNLQAYITRTHKRGRKINDAFVRKYLNQMRQAAEWIDIDYPNISEETIEYLGSITTPLGLHSKKSYVRS